MKYYWLHMVKSKGNGWICRCVDSFTKEDLLKYMAKTSQHEYECREIPKERGENCKNYYIDCDTEEKAEEMRNISGYKSLWMKIDEGLEEFFIMLIIFGIPFCVLLYIGFFQTIPIALWLGGLIIAILFK